MAETAQKNADVLAVLKSAGRPIGPTEIAERVGKPWAQSGRWNVYASSKIVPVLRRIGAVRHKGGLYTPPAETTKETP